MGVEATAKEWLDVTTSLFVSGELSMADRPLRRATVLDAINKARRALYVAGRNQALQNVPRLWRNAAEAIASEPEPVPATDADVDDYVASLRSSAAHARFKAQVHAEEWPRDVLDGYLEWATRCECDAEDLEREGKETR